MTRTPRSRSIEVDPLLYTFKDMLLMSVQSSSEDVQERDLNQRQLSVFLIVGLEDGEHTVRGMAERLGVTKPAITRALDRLEEYELVQRNLDPNDHRSIFATLGSRGAEYLKELSAFAIQAKDAKRPRRRRNDDDE